MGYTKQNFVDGQVLKAEHLNAMEDGIAAAVSVTEQTLTDEQKAQARENIGANLDYAAYGLPVLKLTGDTTGISKDNAVSLGYEYGDRSGSCTLKWQGSSSLAYPKKNYTIKFDNAFEAVEGWGEQKKYCLKANYIDHSHARNVVSAKLWGQIVKSRSTVPTELASLPNGGAVDGFPCCVVINDKYQGLYTFNIPKDGWMFGMSDETLQQAIVCADAHCDATGFMAAATLDGDFDIEYVSDESNSDWVLTSLNTLINAVINSDGTDLDTTIAQYLDWDSAIDYYIFTVLLGGADMTRKNYLLATFDGVKWFFSAYDMDSTYGLDWDGKKFLSARSVLSANLFSSLHRVMYLIMTYKESKLKDRFVEIVGGTMSEENLGVTFENFEAGVPSKLLEEDVRLWPLIPSTSVNSLAQLYNWYRLRFAKVSEEFDEFVGTQNLFVYGTAADYVFANSGEAYPNITVTEERQYLRTSDRGGGASCALSTYVYDRLGGSFNLSAEFVPNTDDGYEAMPRYLLRPLDADGNIITSGVNGWSYLSFYNAFYLDVAEASFTLPATAASFQIGFVFRSDTGSTAAVIVIKNITLTEA